MTQNIYLTSPKKEYILLVTLIFSLWPSN